MQATPRHRQRTPWYPIEHRATGAFWTCSRQTPVTHSGVVTELPLRVHYAFTELPLRWRRFVWHSEVIEITGRVLIWQALLDGPHQSIVPKPTSCIFQAGINNTLLKPLIKDMWKHRCKHGGGIIRSFTVTVEQCYTITTAMWFAWVHMVPKYRLVLWTLTFL